MKQLLQKASTALLILLVAAAAVGCKSTNRFDAVAPGAKGEEILVNYGAPERIQKVMQYEVWLYTEYNSKQCHLIMKKNELAQPVKCFYNHASAVRGLTSQK